MRNSALPLHKPRLQEIEKQTQPTKPRVFRTTAKLHRKKCSAYIQSRTIYFQRSYLIRACSVIPNTHELNEIEKKLKKKFDLFRIQTYLIALNPHGLKANRTSPVIRLGIRFSNNTQHRLSAYPWLENPQPFSSQC
jgi:hypothetical protein